MNMQYLQEEYMFDEFILNTTSQNVSYLFICFNINISRNNMIIRLLLVLNNKL